MGPAHSLTTAAVISLVLTLGFTAVQKDEKHVFVTALDRNGTPIVGMTAEHFAVRKARQGTPRAQG